MDGLEGVLKRQVREFASSVISPALVLSLAGLTRQLCKRSHNASAEVRLTRKLGPETHLGSERSPVLLSTRRCELPDAGRASGG